MTSAHSTATLTIPNRAEFVRPATTFLVHAVRAHHVPPAFDSLFEVAVTEALANAVKHGRSDRSDAEIICELDVAEHQLQLRIIDGGPGFRVPEPRMPAISEDVESLPESGYGLPIIRSVFPIMRAIHRNNRFGVELELSY